MESDRRVLFIDQARVKPLGCSKAYVNGVQHRQEALDGRIQPPAQKKPRLVLQHSSQRRYVVRAVSGNEPHERVEELGAARPDSVRKARMPAVPQHGLEVEQTAVVPREIPVQQEEGRQPLLSVQLEEARRVSGFQAPVDEIQIERELRIAGGQWERAV